MCRPGDRAQNGSIRALTAQPRTGSWKRKEGEAEQDMADDAHAEEPPSTTVPTIKTKTLGLSDQGTAEAGCEGLECCGKKLRPIIGRGGIGEEAFSVYPHLSTEVSNLIFKQCQRPHTDH